MNSRIRVMLGEKSLLGRQGLRLAISDREESARARTHSTGETSIRKSESSYILEECTLSSS